MDFIIGGLAGAGATIFTNPMDVIKTRLQLQGELRGRHEVVKNYRGMFHSVYVIAKNDGLLALQKGLAPALVVGCCLNSVRLGLYHIADIHGLTRKKNGNVSIQKAVMCSAVCGAVSGLTSNPAFVLKTRIQAASHPSIAVGRQHKYNGMWHGLVTIYKTEGMRGFFAGTGATCLRLSMGSAAQLTTFSAAKDVIQSLGYFANSPLLQASSASALSGVAVAVVICPFDVVTVRLYNQGPATLSGPMYTGAFNCLHKIYRIEGFYGLYKGLGPLYLRIAPHTTLSLVMWDMLNIFFSVPK